VGFCSVLVPLGPAPVLVSTRVVVGSNRAISFVPFVFASPSARRLDHSVRLLRGLAFWSCTSEDQSELMLWLLAFEVFFLFFWSSACQSDFSTFCKVVFDTCVFCVAESVYRVPTRVSKVFRVVCWVFFLAQCLAEVAFASVRVPGLIRVSLFCY